MGELARRKFLVQLAALGLGGGIGASAAWAQETGLTPSGDRLETVRPGQLPSFAAKASPKVQEAYRYAAAHGETSNSSRTFAAARTSGIATMATATSQNVIRTVGSRSTATPPPEISA